MIKQKRKHRTALFLLFLILSVIMIGYTAFSSLFLDGVNDTLYVIEIPDLVGKSIYNSSIDRKILCPLIREEYSDADKGTILSQSIPPSRSYDTSGKKLPLEFIITVSKGKK